MKAIHAGVALIFALASFQLGDCDIYLHNPRGSNNRLNGRNANRQNANRVFDSQNNNKGGYNVGEESERQTNDERHQYQMNYFMSGSRGSNVGASYLDIEWTNQHGCGDGDLNCQIVLQYMCQPHNEAELKRNDIPNRKRNGISEATPRYRRRHPFQTKSEKDHEEYWHSAHQSYVLQEPWPWYDKCYKRSRNKGLFTADQNLKGESSIYTRQDAQGTRYGFECPEERDYYPYWHPTDWIDIAVLVDKPSDCLFYQKESFNVKPKGECMERYPKDPNHFRHDSKYNNIADCVNNGGQWIEFSNYLERAPPGFASQTICESAGYLWAYAYRSEYFDRHKFQMRKECVVPLKEPECKQAPFSRSNHLGNGYGITPNTYKWKLPYYPSQQKQRCFLRIRYNISTNDPLSKLKNDPLETFMGKLPLQLAIDTSQFGRTFQDRSHMFTLEGRAGKIPDDLRVHNVNIRGKRGNIVQVYPAVEYDVVPKRLQIPDGDAIHTQWTGCNTNPNGNDGQGTRGTDRNNLVEMSNAPYSFPVSSGSQMLKSAELIYSFVRTSVRYQDVEAGLASSGFIKYAGDTTAINKLDDELNNASPSFRGYVMKIKRGKYYYMCTRNNNFTNRSQKGRLVVY